MDLALHASDIILSSTTASTSPSSSASAPTQFYQDPDTEDDMNERQDPFPPPLMHFPHCRLDIITFPSLPHQTGSPLAGKIEQVALPGPLVRTLLSRFESDLQQQQTEGQQHHQPSNLNHHPTTKPHSPRSAPIPIQIQRHFDDDSDWVSSRCLLADFTGFREEEAEVLSAQGRLCCWASVVLRPVSDPVAGGNTTGGTVNGGDGKWELAFVVQRVGVRDPGGGWCECF
ncbi:hypothetical protein B0J18DRAFT_467584 [Chaetomium sp. MPI-SDFR-AT-0129]|nr:hypothetical protein B0J18DRAFT_467584 [Chaetomium sp. MPI-SDFR-AT-0129]